MTVSPLKTFFTRATPLEGKMVGGVADGGTAVMVEMMQGSLKEQLI
jgi:hypothetical protein